MITNADKQAAEAFVRGEPLPPALEYSLLVEELRHATTEKERLMIWQAIEELKRPCGGHPPR